VDEPVVCEGSKEIGNICLNDIFRDKKLLADRVDDLGLGFPQLEPFKDQDTGNIEPQDMAAHDVEHNPAVLIASAPNSG
jgi:hypothetical protein